MGRLGRVLISGMVLVMAACDPSQSPSAAEPADHGFAAVKSAVVGMILSPQGEGAAVEAEQLSPAVRAAASPGLVVFRVTVTDHDDDDSGNEDAVASRCPVPPPSPQPPTDKPRLPSDPSSFQRQEYEKRVADWKRRAVLDHAEWLRASQAQASACAAAQARQMEAMGRQLGAPGPEDVAGGPMSERWDVVEAVNRANLLFASILASASATTVPVPVLIFMANLGALDPPPSLRSVKDVHVVLANFRSPNSSPTRLDAWRQAFRRAGTAEIKILDPALTETTLPTVILDWLR
jgi:hypothetical protein